MPFPLENDPVYTQVLLKTLFFFITLKECKSTASSKTIDLFFKLKVFFRFFEIKTNFRFFKKFNLYVIQNIR